MLDAKAGAWPAIITCSAWRTGVLRILRAGLGLGGTGARLFFRETGADELHEDPVARQTT